MRCLQAFCVVQGDERIRTAVQGQRNDLAPFNPGLTERGRHKVETTAAKREEAASLAHLPGLSATPCGGFDSPRSPRSVSPGDPAEPDRETA